MVRKSAAVETDMTATYAVAGVAAFAAGAFIYKKLNKKQTNAHLKEKMVTI